MPFVRRHRSAGLILLGVVLVPAIYAQQKPAATGAPGLKAPLAGILSMGNISFHRQDGGVPDNSLADLEAMPGVFDGLIINFSWEQLEPKPGIMEFAPIDAVLASVRAYNKKNPQKPLRLGLRVWPGPNAPGWAKSLGGDPVTVYHLDMPITVGRFWGKPYRDAWRRFMNRLGDKYDSEPLIAQVTNSSGSTITDEPFIVAGDPKSVQNLNRAGFSDAMFRDVRSSSPDDYASWKTTIVECAINPYRNMNSGHPKPDVDLTLMLVRDWRQKMGARGLLGNHSLNYPPQTNLVEVYNLIRQLGQPIEFQTHSPRGLDWDGTIQYAISLGATAVELWPGTQYGGFTKLPVETLKQWSEKLKANVKK
jgi:hypothetical protein